MQKHAASRDGREREERERGEREREREREPDLFFNLKLPSHHTLQFVGANYLTATVAGHSGS